MADFTELSYSSFHGWFSPGFVAFLREIPTAMSCTGRLESVRDVLIHDATFISLFDDAVDVYALRDDVDGANLLSFDRFKM